MKLALAVLVVLAALQKVHNSPLSAAAKCEPSKCTIAKNCRCASTAGPLSLEETPQLIVLAFVDAAKQDLYENRWGPLVEPRTNPDKAFVSATFYVPHEYSDYQIIHDLAINGFEIGAHSVTNNPDQSYWRNANESLLQQEFGANRKIIAKFANIPEENIIGTLTPQLQLAGDNSITAFSSANFTYDNSWPSRNALYPYTLEFSSDQDCDTGASCPEESHPGFWIAPINDLKSEDGDVCATLAACFRTRSNQTVQEISNWLVEHVKNIKTLNKAPITFIIEENLFNSVNNSFDGLTQALDIIQKDKDVFLVSQARVIEWIKNPVPLANFTTSPTSINTGCVKDTCNLKKENGDARYMVSCIPCPKNYPWLNNPEGN